MSKTYTVWVVVECKDDDVDAQVEIYDYEALDFGTEGVFTDPNDALQFAALIEAAGQLLIKAKHSQNIYRNLLT